MCLIKISRSKQNKAQPFVKHKPIKVHAILLAFLTSGTFRRSVNNALFFENRNNVKESILLQNSCRQNSHFISYQKMKSVKLSCLAVLIRCADGQTIPEEIPASLTGCYADASCAGSWQSFSWYQSKSGWDLTKLKVWKTTWNSINTWMNIQLTFSEGAGAFETSSDLGIPISGAQTQIWTLPQSVTQYKQYGANPMTCFKLSYAGSSSTTHGSCDWGAPQYTANLTGPLIGFHCLYQVTTPGVVDFLYGCNPIQDSTPCVPSVTWQNQPQNTSVLLGSQPLNISYQIIQNPYCTTALTYELIPNTNAFLSIYNPSSTGGSVRVSGATSADAGVSSSVYSIVLRATHSSGFIESLSFDVTIYNCQSFTITNQIANLSTYIYSAAITTTSFTTQACDFPVTYKITYQKNGNSITAPSWSTFNEATLNFSFAAQITTAGLYNIKVSATIPVINPSTGSNWKQFFSFDFDVKHDCQTSTLVDRAINDMSFYIGSPATTQDATFLDSISETHGNSAYCGSRSLTLSPTLSYLTISSSNIVLSTTNVANAGGPINVTLTVKLSSYQWTVPSLTKTFKVTIICEVQTVTFTTPPPLTTSLMIDIDVQPRDIVFAISYSPACIQTITQSLTPSTHAFLSLVNLTNSGGKVRISGATAANVGTYSLGLAATSQNLVSSTSNFGITILPCTVTSFSIANPILDLTGMIYSAAVTTSAFSVVMSPICPYAMTISDSYTLAGASIAAPSWSTLNQATLDFSFAAQITNQGAYTITTTATIPFVNPATGQNWETSFSFVFDVKHDCTISSIVDRTITDMSYFIGIAAATTQDATFLDSISEAHGNSAYCGARVLTLSPTCSFLTFTSPNIVLFTKNIADASGPLSITLTVALANYPSVQLSKTFQVIIALALDFLIAPTSQVLQVGIDAQPLDIPISLTETGMTLSFALTPSGLPFISYLSQTSTTGVLRISGATQQMQGTYSIVLTVGTPVGIENSSSFDVTLIDPCFSAKFLPSPAPVPDLSLFMPAVMTLSQTINVMTDVKNAYGVLCEINAAVSPTMAFLKVIQDQIQISGSAVQPANLGQHIFTLTATSPTVPGSMSYLFTVTISCQIAIKPTTLSINGNHLATLDPSYMPSAFNVPVFTITPSNCFAGQPNMALLDQTGGPAPNYMSLSSTRLVVDTQDATLMGQHTFLITATVQSTNYLLIGSADSVTAQINIIIPDNQCSKTKMIGDPAFKDIELLLPEKKTSVTLNFSYEEKALKNTNCGAILIKAVNAETNNPVDWAKLDNARLDIDLNAFGSGFTKRLRVEAWLEDHPAIAIEQVVQVTLSHIEITCNAYSDVQYMPGSARLDLQVDYTSNAKSDSPLTAVITPLWMTGEATNLVWPTFLSFDAESKTFSLQTDVLETVGLYRVGLHIQYKEFPDNQWTCDRQIEITTPGQAAKKDGKITLEDFRFDLLHQMKTKQANKTPVNSGSFIEQPRLEAKIVQIDAHGKVSINFNREIHLVPDLTLITNSTIDLAETTQYRRLITKLNERAKVPVLDVKLIPSDETDITYLNFTWNVTKMRNKTIEIQFFFATPEYISQGTQPDQVEIDFNDPLLFMSEDGLILDPAFRKIKKRLPQQLSLSGTRVQLEQTIETISSTFSFLVPSNILVSIFASGALNLLLGMVEVQQLVLLYGMISINFPPNALAFFNIVAQIAAFDLFNTDAMLEKLLKIQPIAPFDTRFADLGFSSGYFLNNLGTQLFVFIGIFILLFLLKVLKCLRIKKIKHRVNQGYYMVKNVLVALTIESYAIISISCLLSYRNLKFDSPGQFIQSVSSIAAFLVLTFMLYPLLYLYIHWNYVFSVNRLKKNYKIYLRNLNANKGRIVVIWPIFSLMRRLLLTLSIVWFAGVPAGQILLVDLNIIFAWILLEATKPFKSPSKQFIANLNEVFTMVILYHFICFTPFIPEPKTKLVIGSSFCVLESLNLVLNLIYILVGQVKDGIRVYQIWKAKKMRKRQMLEEKPTKLKTCVRGFGLRRQEVKLPDEALENDDLSKSQSQAESSLYEEFDISNSEGLEEIRSNDKAQQRPMKQQQMMLNLLAMPLGAIIEEDDEIDIEKFVNNQMSSRVNRYDSILSNDQVPEKPQFAHKDERLQTSNGFKQPPEVVHPIDLLFLADYYERQQTKATEQTPVLRVQRNSITNDNGYGLLDEPGLLNFGFEIGRRRATMTTDQLSFEPNGWPEHHRINSQVSLLYQNEDFHLLDQTYQKIIEKENVELVHQQQEVIPDVITSIEDHLNRPEAPPVIEGYELATKTLDKQIQNRKEKNTDLEAGNI